jgi:hypothetical protein
MCDFALVRIQGYIDPAKLIIWKIIDSILDFCPVRFRPGTTLAGYVDRHITSLAITSIRHKTDWHISQEQVCRRFKAVPTAFAGPDAKRWHLTTKNAPEASYDLWKLSPSPETEPVNLRKIHFLDPLVALGVDGFGDFPPVLLDGGIGAAPASRCA